jgi:hypothetical protein
MRHILAVAGDVHPPHVRSTNDLSCQAFRSHGRAADVFALILTYDDVLNYHTHKSQLGHIASIICQVTATLISGKERIDCAWLRRLGQKLGAWKDPRLTLLY